MIKFLSKFFIITISVFALLVMYISYFGIETKKFDNLIKKKSNEFNKKIKIEFENTKIYLKPFELNLAIKLQNPRILIEYNTIKLSKLDIFLSIKSFFNSNFSLKKVEVAFVENDIKDLTKITNIFLPMIINKEINKIFVKGKLYGEFIIPFDSNGRLAKGYGFSGKVIDASLNFKKEFNIKNLTAEIKHSKKYKANLFNIKVQKGSTYGFDLSGSNIDLIRENKEIKISSLLATRGEFNIIHLKQLFSILNIDTENFIKLKGIADFKTNINFKINKIFKIKNLDYLIEGNIPKAEIIFKEYKIFKEYLPSYNDEVVLKDTKIKIINQKSSNHIELSGLIKNKDKYDNFKIEETYDYSKKFFKINGFIDLTNSLVKITQLNYNKKSGEKSKISFDINFSPKKFYNINKLIYLSDKTKVRLSNIQLGKNFEINDFKELEFKTFNKNIKNNDFLVKKSKNITILGKVFDAQPLLKTLYKNNDKNKLSKNFTSQIKINFDKTISGTDDDIKDFGMIAFINKGSFDKLSLKGNFSEKEIVEMSIYKINNNQKTLHIISDRARPFIKNFEFIKGFEGGKLEFESNIIKGVSNSNLSITDFKVSKVPALAKLLTLASLRGIADTLSGEGISFDLFEMKSNSKDNVMNIEDALAIGPAVSILLKGYVDKGSIVSLRGTLVPATKLNEIIASIPVVGEILVGKKTGEGVVGVSFKMKGPPADIKTTVNPIKTLTPRFIVRAVEKMKNKKINETK